MMKLKHLFENPMLAEMLLMNWDYDPSSLDLFQYYRISSNAIYPFRKNGEICYLRCCPISEKSKENILAELEFIHYLQGRQYQALEALPSKGGEFLVQKATPWGEYYASVFKRVKGEQISELDLNDEIIFAYGAALGQLHQLSTEYNAYATRRWMFEQVLDWMEATLESTEKNPAPLSELKLLREYFSRLPRNRQNFGLVHYDFEPDNVFYDETTKSCSVIDFDDCMIHWYIMDIEQSLDSLRRSIKAAQFPHKEAVFLDGYRSQYELDKDLFAARPAFKRFANLYRYTRITRATREGWEHEPEWVAALRVKLNGIQVRAAADFGKPLPA